MDNGANMSIDEFPGETKYRSYDPDKINTPEDLADYLSCLRAENDKLDDEVSSQYAFVLQRVVDVIDDCLIENQG